MVGNQDERVIMSSMGKNYYDITMDFSAGMMVYPGDPPVEIIEKSSIKEGGLYNLSVITFGSHTGTHIDAPRHFYADGLTVDRLPLECFIGKAKVLEIKGKDAVTAADLMDFDINKGDIVLLKTRNSTAKQTGVFDTGFAYLTLDAAEYLCRREIRTLGFDYLSVEKYQSDVPEVHYLLLKHNIVILEGLLLRDVVQGEYDMVALPIKITNGNGSPVRAVLIEDK